MSARSGWRRGKDDRAAPDLDGAKAGTAGFAPDLDGAKAGMAGLLSIWMKPRQGRAAASDLAVEQVHRGYSYRSTRGHPLVHHWSYP